VRLKALRSATRRLHIVRVMYELLSLITVNHLRRGERLGELSGEQGVTVVRGALARLLLRHLKALTQHLKSLATHPTHKPKLLHTTEGTIRLSVVEDLMSACCAHTLKRTELRVCDLINIITGLTRRPKLLKRLAIEALSLKQSEGLQHVAHALLERCCHPRLRKNAPKEHAHRVKEQEQDARGP
jgi:hypothetical protein